MSDWEQKEEVALTRALVAIDSTNPGAYEGAAAEFVAGWLRQNTSAEVFYQPVGGGRNNVVARLRGQSRAHSLVYICHMDTVPVGEGWTKNPFGGEIDDQGRLYGRGSCDMKAGLAAALLAFRNIARQESPLKYDFLLIATADEEGGMTGAEQVVKDALVDENSYVLDAEPTAGEIQVAHKGKTWFVLHVHGKTCHASMPQEGCDAIAAMSEIIAGVRRRVARLPVHPEMGSTTATFGTIHGGWNPYIVPDSCTATVDMRLVPPVTNEESIALMEAAIADSLAAVPGTTCDYTLTSQRPPIEKDEGSFLLERLKRATAATGHELPVSFFPGYTDTAVIAAMTGNRNCMSFGPGDLKQAHRPDEFVFCGEITRSVAVMSALAKDILL